MIQKGGLLGDVFFFENEKTMIVDGVLEASLIQLHQKEKNELRLNDSVWKWCLDYESNSRKSWLVLADILSTIPLEGESFKSWRGYQRYHPSRASNLDLQLGTASVFQMTLWLLKAT